MTPELHTMICLSTAHIASYTNDMLHYRVHNDILPVYYRKGEYGYFVCVYPLDETGDEAKYPDDIQALYAYARQHNANWIMLDQDGPVMEGLQTYEW